LPDGEVDSKQKAFVAEYLIDLNATQAAIRAGYSKNSKKSGQRLLTNVDIKTYIDEQLEKIHNEKIADAKEVMITPYGVWIETLIKLMLKVLFQL